MMHDVPLTRREQNISFTSSKNGRLNMRYLQITNNIYSERAKVKRPQLFCGEQLSPLWYIRSFGPLNFCKRHWMLLQSGTVCRYWIYFRYCELYRFIFSELFNRIDSESLSMVPEPTTFPDIFLFLIHSLTKYSLIISSFILLLKSSSLCL